MKIRVMAAVCAAKMVGYICKKMGRQGVTWAGKVALTICPDILEQLSSQVRKDIFATCGTNGKTTTNNMLCAALEAEGQKVICNHTGSNMLNGVVAAFVLAAGWNGKIDADYACIEADEASTRHIFPRIKPDYMLLTNLFRDQLDRYGEIDITMNILEEMMRKVPDMKIIVNGDDALSAYLAMDSGNSYITYGISRPVQKSAANEIREGRFCKKCGAKLEYSFYHYSQLGDYKCPKCGEILELIVSKTARSKGIGQKLIQKIEKYFKSIGCEYINVDVFAYNKNAINFYEKSGYHTRGLINIKKI